MSTFPRTTPQAPRTAPALPGLFITLEGGEGTGKSTLTKRLALGLQLIEAEVIASSEPGNGAIGQSIRAILLDKGNTHLSARAEALLYAADRAQHVDDLIRPALQRGATVVCDRHIDSSVAYQGHARDLGSARISDLSTWATSGVTPDLTFLIDLDPKVGLARKSDQDETNRMEELDLSFHNAVRAGFLLQAKKEPQRIIVVDGNQSLEAIYASILQVTLTKIWSLRNSR